MISEKLQLLRPRINKVFSIAFGWSLGMFIFSLYEFSLLGTNGHYPNGMPYDFRQTLWLTPLVAFMGGIMLGTFEIFFLEEKLKRKPFGYSLFYLRFIENASWEGEGTFMQLSQLQEFKIWCGYAYESICMKHVPQIKKALGISGVYTTTYSYFKKATEDEKGLQIDMLIERADHIINLFEIKFYNTEFSFSKAYSEQVRERLHLFLRLSKTRKHVFMTTITTFGVKHNQHSLGLVEPNLTLDDLFE